MTLRLAQARLEETLLVGPKQTQTHLAPALGRTCRREFVALVEQGCADRAGRDEGRVPGYAYGFYGPAACAHGEREESGTTQMSPGPGHATRSIDDADGRRSSAEDTAGTTRIRAGGCSAGIAAAAATGVAGARCAGWTSQRVVARDAPSVEVAVIM